MNSQQLKITTAQTELAMLVVLKWSRTILVHECSTYPITVYRFVMSHQKEQLIKSDQFLLTRDLYISLISNQISCTSCGNKVASNLYHLTSFQQNLAKLSIMLKNQSFISAYHVAFHNTRYDQMQTMHVLLLSLKSCKALWRVG